MSGPIWTFQRGDDVIVLRCPQPLELIAFEPTHQLTRRFYFHDSHDRVTFQAGFEYHLLSTGWSLSAFSSSHQREERLSALWTFWRRDS